MGLYLSINEPQPTIPSGSVKQLNYQEYGTYVTAYKVWLPVKHELLNGIMISKYSRTKLLYSSHSWMYKHHDEKLTTTWQIQ